MSFFWLYGVPSFVFFLIVILFFAGFSLVGYLLTRKRVERWLGPPPAQNEVISYYIAATGVVYGITLGLIAVSVWDTYVHVTVKVEEEAANLSVLYRDVKSYKEPYRSQLMGELKTYTRYLIEKAWPQQEQGITPTEGVDHMDSFQEILYKYEPTTDGQRILHSSAVHSYENYIALRRQRVQSVGKGVASMIWWVVFFGALVNLTLSWLFVVRNKTLHILMNALLGALIGALIYVIIVLDFPFQGWFRVSSEPFKTTFNHLMK